MTDEVLTWLAEGDPAVRWQTERDLLDRPADEWEATRRRIAAEGWGRELLTAQDDVGTWGGGLYGPKWISTTYTLLLLRRFGLDRANAAALSGCRRLLDDAVWVDGGVSYFGGHTLAERCVNGMVLSITSWFDADDDRIDDIAELLLSARMPDGAWNCRDHQGDTHSSFHTTISVLEGLLVWKRRRATDAADAALASGAEFMLRHRMLRSHRTGKVINPRWLDPSFPPRWHYDILRGLDHLRDAGASPDERAEEAVALVRAAQRRNGRWKVGPRYSGRTFFIMEPGRQPGRWNTLRSLRVLRWWDGG